MSGGGDGENYNRVGCGALTRLIEAGFFGAGYSTLGTGTRPVGTIMCLIMRGIKAPVSIYRITVGMIRGDRNL